MDDQFSEQNLRAALGERPFRFHEQVGSTQDMAREWAIADPSLAGGAVVIAEHQTAGRGRQGRAWIAPPHSAITCSVVLRPHIVPEHLPRVTMVGGVAVDDTLASLLPGRVVLKWPNDVLVGGKKICGILTEATWIGDRLAAVILGIGINVRGDFAGTPLEARATSVEAELGRGVDRRVLLANLVRHIDVWMAQINERTLFETWRDRLGTLGKRVTVYTEPHRPDSPSYTGVADSVDDSGALVVRLDSGERQRVLAADVGLVEDE